MRLLKNTVSGLFSRYPRTDDGLVVGLENYLVVYEYIVDVAPAYNIETQVLETQLVDDIVNRIYRKTYIVRDLTTNEVIERFDSTLRWDDFMRAFYRSSAYNRFLIFGVTEPIIIMGLQEIAVVLLGFKTEPMLRTVFLRMRNRMNTQSLTLTAAEITSLNNALAILGVTWTLQTIS